MAQSPPQSVMLLSIPGFSPFEGFFDDVLRQLRNTYTLIGAGSIGAAYEILRDRKISTIIVCEPSMMTRARDGPVRDLVNQIIGFTCGGGTTIFALACANFVRPSDLDAFFANIWDLPWKSGDSSLLTTFEVNPTARIKLPDHIASTYSVEAVNLKNVSEPDLLYRTNANAKLRSPEFDGNPMDLIGEGPVVLSVYGNGKVGWIGDLHDEKETQALLVAICGI